MDSICFPQNVYFKTSTFNPSEFKDKTFEKIIKVKCGQNVIPLMSLKEQEETP